jgi:hypothetical protein
MYITFFRTTFAFQQIIPFIFIDVWMYWKSESCIYYRYLDIRILMYFADMFILGSQSFTSFWHMSINNIGYSSVYVNDWNDWQNQSFEKAKVWAYVPIYSIENDWQNASVIYIIELSINWKTSDYLDIVFWLDYYVLISFRIHMFCLFIAINLISLFFF